MIIPMKKIQLIFHSSMEEEGVLVLQNLGVVDINTLSIDVNSEEAEEYKDLSLACEYLSEFDVSDTDHSREYVESNGSFLGTSILSVAKKVITQHQSQQVLKKERDEMQVNYDNMVMFGDISQHSFQELREKGVHAALYRTDKKEKYKASKRDTQCVVEKVATNDQYSYWVVISYGEERMQTPLSWQEFTLLEHTPQELHTKITHNRAEIKKLNEELYKLYKSGHYNTLLVRKLEMENVLLRQQVIQTGTVYENELLLVEGFIPQPECDAIKSVAQDNGWGVIISEPAEEEEVPTLTKNFPFVKIIKPLFKLMDTVPGYREFDISAVFLLFITLFFSMIIGDAGYGVVLLLGTGIAMIKASKSSSVGLAHILLLWFSVGTIVWGAITGNWFGYAPLSEISWLKIFIVPAIANVNEASQETIMLFCFRVGLVHLVFAHLWRVVRVCRESLWAVLHEFANIAMLIGLYFVTLMLLLDPNKYPLPNYAIPFILIGFGVIVITSEQEKGRNFFLGIGKGLASLFTLFLGGVSSLADLISYIRLFAVGLASLAIAQAFNEMGLSIMASDVSSPIVVVLLVGAGSIVMLFGHVLNLAMGLLAVMVHGVRLNMLEFGMHLGMEWTGKVFTPFQIQKKSILLEEK